MIILGYYGCSDIVNKIIASEPRIYITPYKASIKPTKSLKKPLQRRKMMKR